MTQKDKTKIKKCMELISSVGDNDHKDVQFKRFIIEQLQFWSDSKVTNNNNANKNIEIGK